MTSPTATTTRKQLRGYGVSRYLARRLTQALTPVNKLGNAYVYRLEHVIGATRTYQSNTRIQEKTRQLLEQVMTQLLSRVDNVVPILPNSPTTEVSEIAKQLLNQMHQTDRAMAEMKATAASASHGQT
ncbi:MAG: hypothetical protein AB8B99_18720 [Phormidesmis sp.]